MASSSGRMTFWPARAGQSLMVNEEDVGRRARRDERHQVGVGSRRIGGRDGEAGGLRASPSQTLHDKEPSNHHLREHNSGVSRCKREDLSFHRLSGVEATVVRWRLRETWG